MTIAMLGRTGAGKTTTALRLQKTLGYELVESAGMREELGLMDCFSDEVRDLSYRRMIDRAGGNVILDASFHRRERRQWLYEAVDSVVFVYCVCSDLFEVKRRILSRKNVDGCRAMADDLAVYDLIDNTFEEIEPFEIVIPTVVFTVDTFTDSVSEDWYGLVDGAETVREVLDGVMA